jgi:hypothetical protein
MHSTRCLGTVLVALAGLLSLPAGRAEALTAATGTVSVTVVANPLFPASSTITITATFDDATYDLPGVNLGDSLGSVSATSVALTNVNLGTGAHFVIPFTNAGPKFEAQGDIACPTDGCISPTPAERYGFIGFLQNVNASVGLPADNVYTFDGSASCTLGGITLTCTGDFSLNAFPVDDVVPPTDTVDRTVTFTDPTPPGGEREFTARVELSGITTGGMVSITGLSRYRGTIPAGYALSSGAFRALFFDIESDAVFTSGRACVEVDANLDGFVDVEPSLTLTQLAILHATTPGNPFAAAPVIFLPPFVCIDVVSFSPFVLLVDLTPPTTTTTVPGGGTTTTLPGEGPSTTTTIASTPGTSTTLQSCTTARECLQKTKSGPLCEETINPKLQNVITKKTAAAETKLGKAASATSAAKAAKFQKQAKAAISAILKKADAFVNKKKGPISSTCRDAIRAALQPVISQIDGSKF